VFAKYKDSAQMGEVGGRKGAGAKKKGGEIEQKKGGGGGKAEGEKVGHNC